MKLLVALALTASLVACSKPDLWAVCRGLGPPGFGAQPLRCDGETCRACVSSLEGVWRARAEASQRAAFRARFMTVAADARDAFASRARPDGSYPFEHCTVGTRPGAACAAYSAYCVDVIARGLRSGDTSLADRAQYNLAASKACSAARASLVANLSSPCDASVTDTRCEGASCASCVASRLAAMSVLAPRADEAQGGADFTSVIDATPESVARSIAETLGAPDPPTDLETVVIQRALRRYCFAIVAHSASAPPYACNAVMTRFLTHDDYGDAALAWEALGRAQSAVRGAVLDAVLLDAVRSNILTTRLVSHLAALPREGTTDALTRATRLPTTTDGAYAGLRALLIRSGVTGLDLPPVNRPSTPSTSAPTVNGTAPAAPHTAPSFRLPVGVSQQQG
jgi:hypothetical protein